MIVHRLTIRNYRGVEEASVEFSPVGITVIEGDNEVGKTSLTEALSFIFEYPDNSKHRDIAAIKPTHHDEGPEIELEAEAGPYRFNYFKRYFRRPSTELTINFPEPENHTGRQAHDRAEQILGETVDRDLWKAVSVLQGKGISQADLSGASSLTAALDKAAGGEAVGDEENSLFELVEKEFKKYYTGTGTEKKDLVTARHAGDEFEQQLTDLQQQALDVEKDTERAASLKEEIRMLKETINKLKKEDSEVQENLVKVEVLEGEIKNHDLELGNLDRDRAAAERDHEDRKAMIQRITDREQEIEELSGELVEIQQTLAGAESAVKEAKEELDKASKTLKSIRQVRDHRQKDHDYYRNLLDLKQMEERKVRIDESRNRAIGAGAVLEKIQVTDEALVEILEAERNRDSAKAQLEVGAPSLVLTSPKTVDLKVDGKKVRLKSGQEELRTVRDEMSILVPDVLEIKVVPGTSSEGLARQLEQTEERLALILEKNEVKDSADARRQIQAREKAKLQIEEVKGVEKQDLRDLTYEELTGRIEGLKEGTATYLKDRVKSPVIAADQDSARIAQQQTEEELEKAEGDHEIADSSYRAAEEKRNALREQIAETKGAAGNLVNDLKELEEELKAVRKETSDNVLEEKLAEIQKAANEKQGVIGLKREELSRLNPEQVRALMESSKGSLNSAEERLRGRENEEIDLKARLSVRREEGLHERIQEVESLLFRKNRDNRSLFRRAAAARLLFMKMKEERDEAFESYKAPFKDKIKQLGRLVYNDTFQVILEDDLSIKERVLNDITVSFESLSGGAREQVSMLARVAAAILVSEDNAVPIIIDDALGYTSPKRLKYMGAVLAQAGKAGQVIVLTCTPERYAHLGEVKRVSMD